MITKKRIKFTTFSKSFSCELELYFENFKKDGWGKRRRKWELSNFHIVIKIETIVALKAFCFLITRIVKSHGGIAMNRKG